VTYVLQSLGRFQGSRDAGEDDCVEPNASILEGSVHCVKKFAAKGGRTIVHKKVQESVDTSSADGFIHEGHEVFLVFLRILSGANR